MSIKLLKAKPDGARKADLSKLSILQIDNGMFGFIGEHLAKYFKKVWYSRPVAAAFLHGSQHTIGAGMPGIEWVPDWEPYVAKADAVFVSDVNFSSLQLLLQGFGVKVCGALGAERMELEKWFFLEKLHETGLPVPKTWRFEGIDSVWDFLKNKQEKLWLKGGDKYRGDFESTYHEQAAQTEIMLNDLRKVIGPKRSKNIEILVQKNVPDAIEIGRDGFMLNGKMPRNCTVGIEEKATFYIAKVFENAPPVLENITRKLEPVYDKLKIQGPFSDEVRITKEGKAYSIDPCARPGNPPSSCLVELYGADYAQAVWSLANGEMPVLNPKHSHAAEIILCSNWYAEHDLYVEIPENVRRWVKLRNATRQDGKTYCIRNDTGSHFGSVVAVGNSPEEAVKLAEERAGHLKIYGLEYQKDMWGTMKKRIETAKDYAGIDLT